MNSLGMDLLNRVIGVLRKAVDLRSEDLPDFLQFIASTNNLVTKISWPFGYIDEVRNLDEAVRISCRVTCLIVPYNH